MLRPPDADPDPPEPELLEDGPIIALSIVGALVGALVAAAAAADDEDDGEDEEADEADDEDDEDGVGALVPTVEVRAPLNTGSTSPLLR